MVCMRHNRLSSLAQTSSVNVPAKCPLLMFVHYRMKVLNTDIFVLLQKKKNPHKNHKGTSCVPSCLAPVGSRRGNAPGLYSQQTPGLAYPPASAFLEPSRCAVAPSPGTPLAVCVTDRCGGGHGRWGSSGPRCRVFQLHRIHTIHIRSGIILSPLKFSCSAGQQGHCSYFYTMVSDTHWVKTN